MTIKLELPVLELRRALLCASRDEFRPSLRGVHLTPAGHLVASNGHVLYLAELGEIPELSEPITFRVYGLPRLTDLVARLTLGDTLGILRLYGWDDTQRALLGVQHLSEPFPDYLKVLEGWTPQPRGELRMQTLYGALLEKLWDYGFVMRPCGENEPMFIEPLGPGRYRERLLIMPLRNDR